MDFYLHFLFSASYLKRPFKTNATAVKLIHVKSVIFNSVI